MLFFRKLPSLFGLDGLCWDSQVRPAHNLFDLEGCDRVRIMWPTLAASHSKPSISAIPYLVYTTSVYTSQRDVAPADLAYGQRLENSGVLIFNYSFDTTSDSY